jgi:ArsR family transcriptional regulator, arsenate/arsenite/antimonite-responsive transcriptional repressor / arsenate reductase (thioredoxin)
MDSKAASVGFSALAKETRLDAMRVLANSGRDGVAAGDLAVRLGLPPSTLSFHLAALEQAGLIAPTRRGRQLFYAVRINGLRALFSFLTETCCAGQPQLCFDINQLLPKDTPEEKPMSAAFNVLFLCTHNSARSIMAEAILEKIGNGKFNAYSAGSEPAHRPLPEVIDRLRTVGHDVTKLRSKSWNEFIGPDAPRMDFVFTLCDSVQAQVCPDFGDRPVTAAWPFPDPTKFTGSEAERATLLTETYGMIRRRLEIFTNLPFASLDRMALKARLDELSDSTRPYLVRT